MAVETVKRVEIVGLSKHREKTLDFLHELGVMHLSSYESMQNKHSLVRSDSLPKLSSVAQSLLTLKWYSDVLSPYTVKPLIRQKWTSYEQNCKDYTVLQKALSELDFLVSKKNDLEEDIARLDAKKKILEPIPFDIHRDMLDTQFCKTFVFEGEYDDFKGTKMIDHGYTVLQVSNALFERQKKLISSRNPIDLSIIEVSSSVDGQKDRAQYDDDALQLREVTEKLRQASSSYLGEVLRLQEQFALYRERYEKTSYMLATDTTFVLQGYLPAGVLQQIDPPVPLHISEIEKENDVPVKLKHAPYVKHFAFITRMFGLPVYKSIDPTVYLSIFIPLFFGFMFSDIGYGILVLLVAGALLFKATSRTPILKNAGVVLSICGVSTIIFGALFGAFFGNLFAISPLLFDPFQNAQAILITSLAIGLVHINLGLILAFRKNTVGVLSLWFLQIGSAMLALGMGQLSWLVLGASFALFIYKNKLMGLMDITAFAGTWFSYARLLALALATGGIALGINIIGNLVGGIPFIGTVLLILVLIIGHLFNFALNILGSSIHSVRLHYIEFFSQFYEAGGKPYVAFTTKKVQDEL